jgi:thiol:disulfide interchange protein DsbD
VAIAALAALPVRAVAAAEPEPIAARLVAERDALVPGDTTLLGIAFEVSDGWHLFWDGRNDTGGPVSVRPALPDGFRAGDLLWPAPKRLVSPGRILDHVYDDDVLLILPVVAPRDAKPGDRATLSCALDWVACRDACVLGEAAVSLTLPIAPAESGGARASAAAPLFERARARLPRTLPAERDVFRWRWSADTLHIESRAAQPLAFYPGAACGDLVDPIADAVAASGHLALRFRPTAPGRRIGPASGLLVLGPQAPRDPVDPPEVYAIDIPPPTEQKEVQ